MDVTTIALKPKLVPIGFRALSPARGPQLVRTKYQHIVADHKPPRMYVAIFVRDDWGMLDADRVPIW